MVARQPAPKRRKGTIDQFRNPYTVLVAIEHGDSTDWISGASQMDPRSRFVLFFKFDSTVFLHLGAHSHNQLQ